MQHAYKLSRFVELLELQSSGESRVPAMIYALGPPCPDATCFSALYQEWLSAFSYRPGRLDALWPLLSLGRRLCQQQMSDENLELADCPEWQALLKLRGPAESVLFRRCQVCFQELPVIHTSGLYDGCALVCPDCGSVYFQAYGDTSSPPACGCGGQYPATAQPDCPHCGSQASEVSREISPYQYFAEHPFQRGPNA